MVEFLAFDPNAIPNSIYSCVLAARENARSVRETISSEMWEQVNSLYLLLTGEGRQRYPRTGCPPFSAACVWAAISSKASPHATMSHNEAWQFIRLGRSLERADKTSRILDVKYYVLLPSVTDVGTPYDDIQWAAVLKSVSGFEMYRKRHGRIPPDANRGVPAAGSPISARRALLHRPGTMRPSTPSAGARGGRFPAAPSSAWGSCARNSISPRSSTILQDGLHEFFDALQGKMNTIDECILGDFLAQRPYASLSAGG